MTHYDKTTDRRQRQQVLRRLEDWLETPMFVLSLLWAALLVLELTRGLEPALQTAVTVIWVIFLLEFLLKFIVAPRKLVFLRKSWLTVFALALPALRLFRVVRVARVLRAGPALRGLTLARVLAAFNRGLRDSKTALGKFGFGYVVALTLLVTGLGAAGMFAFERPSAGGRLASFGDALWFTAMLMTTSGSDYWPQTAEGRVLCFLLALYAFAIFGYVTATLATLLIGQQAQPRPQHLDGESLATIQADLSALNQSLAALARKLPA